MHGNNSPQKTSDVIVGKEPLRSHWGEARACENEFHLTKIKCSVQARSSGFRFK